MKIIDIFIFLNFPVISNGYMRVCFYANTAKSRKNYSYLPENVDPRLCSHIIYSHALITNGTITSGQWNDESPTLAKGMYEKMTDLKKIHKKLKILLSVQEHNLDDKQTITTISSGANRKAFIKSSINYLRTWKFDGLNLDFECPDLWKTSPSLKMWFTKLVQEFRRAFDAEKVINTKPKLLLSITVAVGLRFFNTKQDIYEISKQVDFINALTFDFNMSLWHWQFVHNASLYSEDDDKSVHKAVSFWKENVHDQKKLLIGLSAHGRCFRISPRRDLDAHLYDRIGCQPDAQLFDFRLMPFYRLCQLMKTKSVERRWLVQESVPFLIDQRENYWIGYDDVKSIELKVKYMLDSNLGGWSFWDVSTDDFKGVDCGLGRYPLLMAANKEMAKSGKERFIFTELASPPKDLKRACKDRFDGQYYHPTACTLYVQCRLGRTSVLRCPANLVFDETFGNCTHLRRLDAKRMLLCVTRNETTVEVVTSDL